jgi:hypothetical protein
MDTLSSMKLAACLKAERTIAADQAAEIVLEEIKVVPTLHDRMQNWGSD